MAARAERKACLTYHFSGDPATYFAFYSPDTFGDAWQVRKFDSMDKPHVELGTIRKNAKGSNPFTWPFTDYDGQRRTMCGPSIKAGVEYLKSKAVAA